MILLRFILFYRTCASAFTQSRPVSSIGGQRHLRSAKRGPSRVTMTTYGRRAFEQAGPSTRNALSNYLTLSVYF